MYQVLNAPLAKKDLRKLAKNKAVFKAVSEKISDLANDPRPSGCIKIKGAGGLYRIRHGDYRVVYQIKNQELIVLLVRVAHRKDVYK